MNQNPVAIIGAGPAGLTAAYLLSKAGVPVVVFEADPKYVGGISKTATFKGYHFDIGGHRFFSKSQEVEDLWSEILPNDMLVRPRSSRILYRGQFFSYPLKASEALLKLGIVESLRCGLSYFWSRLFPVRPAKSFEDWVSNQFGHRLFNIFFKTYTEKVWGMSCQEISADWAAQRIKGLSLTTAVLNALFPPKKTPRAGGKVVKTLIESFRYPRLGPGMMWEACAAKVQSMGSRVLMGRRVNSCHYDQERAEWTVMTTDEEGREHTLRAAHVISTAPVRELCSMVSPHLSVASLEAAGQLKYRDFITVVLILKERSAFPDNWIYIHDPSVQVGRVQNFKSWSPEMVPDPAMTCYGLEYFCFEDGNGLWSQSNAQLQELARREILQLGLANAEDIVDAHVVRQRKAYPVYDDAYASHLAVIREELDRTFPTLHLVGRNGMHKYNNQDHSMMTAMLCVKNIIAGQRIFDLWGVNEDAEYHESGDHGASVPSSSVSGQRQVPRKISPPAATKA
ncbi:MAG TPA: NAD(P)/FAD-dependent oxidoreductase [Chthoniobacter sp.]|jgi:protoporphyrinogen oxidase